MLEWKDTDKPLLSESGFPGRRKTGTGESARPQINIVLNWFEELKARVSVP